jgi:hypothetical protein
MKLFLSASPRPKNTEDDSRSLRVLQKERDEKRQQRREGEDMDKRREGVRVPLRSVGGCGLNDVGFRDARLLAHAVEDASSAVEVERSWREEDVSK